MGPVSRLGRDCLKNLFESGELVEDSVSSILEHTAKDDKTYKTKFYNLDAIISVGYLVNSMRATQFRIWATERLKEYIIKGFTMDDERLKNPNKIFGQDWAQKLNAFLQFNEREILDNPGKISAEIAKSFAEDEFKKYRIVQDRLFESDFDRVIKQLEQGEKKE